MSITAASTRSSSRLKDLLGAGSKEKKEEKKGKGGTSPDSAEKGASAVGEPKAKSVSPSPAPKLLPLRSALAARAALFRATHYGPGGASSADLETEGLKAMRSLCSDLPAADSARLAALLDALAGGSSGISVFELLGSGAVGGLLGYLEGRDLQGSDGWERSLLSRLSLFASVALPQGSGASPPLAALVQKLQAALSSQETFHVFAARFGAGGAGGSAIRPGGGLSSRFGSGRGMYSGMGGGGGGGAANGGSMNSGLAMLTQPLKLRLSRHSAEDQLRDYNTNVVMIEPLASMKAIEDFLHPRVFRSNAEATEAAASAAAASKAAASIAEGAAAAAAAATAAATALRAAEAAAKSSEDRKAASAAAASKAQPIPEGGANRRMTRAQAAMVEKAETGPGAASAEDGGRKKRRSGKGGRGTGDDDEAMVSKWRPEKIPLLLCLLWSPANQIASVL